MLTPMRAVMLHGPGDLRVEEVPDPAPGPGRGGGPRSSPPSPARPTRRWRRPAPTRRWGRCPRAWATRWPACVERAGDGVAWPRARRRGGGGQLGAVRRVPRLPRRAAEPLRRHDVPHRAPSPSACGCRRGSWPATSTRSPSGMDPAVAALAEPLACAIHSAGRAGDVAGRVVLVLGGGFQGRMLAGLLARRGARGAPGRSARRSGATPPCAPAPPPSHDAPRDAAAARDLRARRCPAARAPTWWWRPSAGPRRGRSRRSLARAGGEVLVHGGRALRRGGRDPRARHPLSRGHAPRRVSPHARTHSRRRCACCAIRRSTCRDVLREPIGLDECPRCCGCHGARSTP